MSSKRFPGLVSGPVAERDRSRNPLWKIRRFVFGGFLLGLLSVFGLFAYGMYFTDPPLIIADNLSEENVFCDNSQTTCTAQVAMASSSTVDADRELIEDASDIPPVFINALVATEDQDFFSHTGVNPVGMTRAFGRTVLSKATGKGVTQGGSSLTQQLVKNKYIRKDMSAWERKYREPFIAVKIERRLAKELENSCPSGGKTCGKMEILRLYSNEVYFGTRGGSLDGLKSATRGYFGKEISDLTLPEAAYLAGVLRAPALAAPEKHPETARWRIDSTLNLMLEEGYITETDLNAATASMDANASPDKYDGIGLPNFVEPKSKTLDVKGKEFGTNYFIDAAKQELAELAESGEVRQGGLKVYTTIDLEKQEQAHKTVTNYVKPDNPKMPNVALVTVDGQGLVRAMVGGANYQERQFNYARDGYTQPGSLNKPFGLATALEQGLSMNSLVTAPSEMVFPGADGGEDWNVSGGNSDFPDAEKPKYGTLREATKRSWNTSYAQIIQRDEVGPQNVAEMIERFGIRAVPESQKVPSLILGVNGATPMEMASAYSTFEREGFKVDPVIIEKIENNKGQVICWYPSNGKCESKDSTAPQRQANPIIDPEIARQVNSALVDVVKDPRGTGKNADQIPHAAGKTGTTQDYQAAWFSGFSCDLTTTVMMGYEGNLRMSDAVNQKKKNDLPPMRELFGDNATSKGNITSGLPAKMWGEYMKAIDKPACNGISISENYGTNIIGQELKTSHPVCGAVPSVAEQPDPNQTIDPNQQPVNPNQQVGPNQQPVNPNQPNNGQQGQPQQREDLVLPNGQVIPANKLRFLSEKQIEEMKKNAEQQLREGRFEVQNISLARSFSLQAPVQGTKQPCLTYTGKNGVWELSDGVVSPAAPSTVPETTMPETTMPETTVPETTQAVPTTKQQPTTTERTTTTKKDDTTTTLDSETSTTKEEGPIKPTVPDRPRINR